MLENQAIANTAKAMNRTRHMDIVIMHGCMIIAKKCATNVRGIFNILIFSYSTGVPICY